MVGLIKHTDNIFFRKPIGLLDKSYDYLIESLSHNIGDFNKNFMNTINPIGEPSDFYYNSTYIPWFNRDAYKTDTSNYIDYIRISYFDGNDNLIDYFSTDDKIKFFDFKQIATEFNHVGVIRTYNYLNSYSYGNVNVNKPFNDTRLGFINNFYLSKTIENSIVESKLRPLSLGLGISNGVYDKFSLTGDYGILYGAFHENIGSVIHQDIINSGPKLLRDGINTNMNISESINFIDLNTDKTNNFLTKSLFGYDLLDMKYNHLTVENLDDGPNLNIKKYIPSYSFGVKYDYISSIADNFNSDGNRITIVNAGNSSIGDRKLYVYNEYGGDGSVSINYNLNSGINYGYHDIYSDNIKKDLIHKTNELFKNGKIDTLLARFKTDIIDDNDLITSKSKQYGMSRGRNLLKREKSNENGYDNPYCRTWTYHHQYKSLSDTIRPFDNQDLLKNSDLEFYRRQSDNTNDTNDSFNGGTDRLNQYGVKNNVTNQVRYTVYNDGGVQQNKPEQCMFSIENLAWKGVNSKSNLRLDDDQIGPMGGRIMWFPPYNLKFNENVSVNWNATNFIGRGEDIYTYVNTSRGGTLSFKLLIDYPSIINGWRGGDNTNNGVSDVDDIESDEQTLLRFFAGCEILGRSKVSEANIDYDKLLESIDLQPSVSTQTLSFIVYFPNNYSGVDDVDDPNINPIEYLLNGIGVNIQGNENGQYKETIPTSVNNIYYYNDERIGGYEINRSYLSIDEDEPLSNNIKNIVDNDGNAITLIPLEFNDSDKKWGYRIDKQYKSQVLLPTNYNDIKSYQLNSKGYKKGAEKYSLNDDNVCSFLDFYLAINNITPNFVISDFIDADRIDNIKKILNNYEIDEIVVTGYASSHGNKNKNSKLANNRAEVVKSHLLKNIRCERITIKTIEAPQLDGNNRDVNSFDAKVWRSAKVDIKYITQKTEAISSDEFITNINQILNNNTNDVVNNIINYIETTTSLSEERKQLLFNLLNESLSQNRDHLNTINDISENESVNGYCNEYLFFSELEKNEPFLHNLLTQKIKYFNPAFHSLSPEGFNARLTFLHQCTRQGATNAQSDNQTNAANLAFGRPPICILRIGDFYNTKIIIESLTINYDDATWDLNPEGIGVMPMMADISINFKFIGGSDLGGPIARLQNALSFNYYANTGVYDRRSDLIEYNSSRNGEISKIKTI